MTMTHHTPWIIAICLLAAVGCGGEEVGQDPSRAPMGATTPAATTEAPDASALQTVEVWLTTSFIQAGSDRPTTLHIQALSDGAAMAPGTVLEVAEARALGGEEPLGHFGAERGDEPRTLALSASQGAQVDFYCDAEGRTTLVVALRDAPEVYAEADVICIPPSEGVFTIRDVVAAGDLRAGGHPIMVQATIEGAAASSPVPAELGHTSASPSGVLLVFSIAEGESVRWEPLHHTQAVTRRPRTVKARTDANGVASVWLETTDVSGPTTIQVHFAQTRYDRGVGAQGHVKIAP